MNNIKYIKYLTTILSLLLLTNIYFNFYDMSIIHSIIFITIFVSSSFYLKIIELEYEIELLKQHVFLIENNKNSNDDD